jgi:hypothetical protein
MSRRRLTPDEESLRPVYCTGEYFSFEDNLVHAQFFNREVTSTDGGFPWKYTDTNEDIPDEDFERFFPHIQEVHHLDWTVLTGTYQNKDVSWSFTQECWVYGNHRPVTFQSTTDSEEEQAQVTELLDSTARTLTALLSQVSQPQTPVQAPRVLPSTPGPSQLPVPVPPSRVNTPPERRASPGAQQAPLTPPATVLLPTAVPRNVPSLVPV